MKEVTTPSGLKYTDLAEGTGREAKKGDTVEVHYTGWLDSKNKDEPFDSSVGRRPFVFPLGGGRVIKGWDEGVAGMKVGGKRCYPVARPRLRQARRRRRHSAGLDAAFRGRTAQDQVMRP